MTKNKHSVERKQQINSFCKQFNMTVTRAEKNLIKAGEADCAYFQMKSKKGGGLLNLYFSVVSLVLQSANAVLEIGTGKGAKAKTLANLFHHALIYTIDIPRADKDFKGLSWQIGNEEAFKQNIGHPRIRFIEKNSFFLPGVDLPEKFDLIFIDGNHCYPFVAWDTAFAYYHVKKGGFIFWDDYSMKHEFDVEQTISHLNGIIKEKISLLPVTTSDFPTPARVAWLRKE